MFDGSSSYLLYFGFKFRRNLVDILWSNEYTGPIVSLLLKVRLGTLSNRSCHDVDHVVGELANVLTHSNKKPSCSQVVVHFYKTLCQLVTMYVKQSLAKFEWNPHI